MGDPKPEPASMRQNMLSHQHNWRGVHLKNCKLMSIDLAKYVFQACQLDENNKVIKNRKLSRAELSKLIVNTPRTVIAMEACYTSHY